MSNLPTYDPKRGACEQGAHARCADADRNCRCACHRPGEHPVTQARQTLRDVAGPPPAGWEATRARGTLIIALGDLLEHYDATDDARRLGEETAAILLANPHIKLGGRGGVGDEL